MKVKKYDDLDYSILAILNKAPTPVFDIWLKFKDEVTEITIIDRRMQHLKKKGLVSNIRGKGWVRA
ncbi:TPA: hypothetical protein ACNTUM_000653 [Escherichia coli]|nr:hypothetical protein [Escherichia coli]HCO3884090.1 hypothetical protein [Escherichia coli]